MLRLVTIILMSTLKFQKLKLLGRESAWVACIKKEKTECVQHEL